MSTSIKRLSAILLAVLIMTVAAALSSERAALAAGDGYVIPPSSDKQPADGDPAGDPGYIIPPSEDPAKPEVKLDPPVVSCSDMPEANYVSVHIYAPPGVQLSEKDRIVYRMDDEEQWEQYTDSIEIKKNGVFHALILYADNTRSEEATVTISSIDMTPPTAPAVKADLKTWIKDKLTVELEPGTDEKSGYLRTEYRIGSDGQWTEYTGKFDVTSNCVLYVRGVDKAGNYSEEVNVKISNFDTTPPDMAQAQVILSSTSGFTSSESNTFSKIFKGDVSFIVSGMRDDESGVAYYEYQAAGSTSNLSDTGWKRCELKDSPVIKGDFCGYVFVRGVDKVGNVSTNVTSEGFIIDTTPPAISDIALTPSTLTDGRVTIKFSVTDNSQISEVTVNGAYVGVYSTSYTVYRNGDYVIRAVDAAGNVASRGVTVSNINSTPFTLVNTFQSLNESSFTPSTWAEAKAAATTLQGQLTVGASEDQISASYERLLAAMEALVTKGDGTASIALIGRINTDYDKENYTESSWQAVEQRMDELTKLLDEPERTQEQVDNARRSLENALVDLVPRGNFDSLDALIAQCDVLDPSEYDQIKFNTLKEALEYARGLSRTDSSQEVIDEAYNRLLTATVELKDAPRKEGFNFTLVFFVIIALLIIAIGTALFIINRRMKAEKAEEEPVGRPDDDERYPEDDYYPESPAHQPVGDLYFTDEDDGYDDGYDNGAYNVRRVQDTGLPTPVEDAEEGSDGENAGDSDGNAESSESGDNDNNSDGGVDSGSSEDADKPSEEDQQPAANDEPRSARKYGVQHNRNSGSQGSGYNGGKKRR